VIHARLPHIYCKNVRDKSLPKNEKEKIDVFDEERAIRDGRHPAA
jgi:hypothetical protein